MITPRTTRLLRTPGLRALQRTIALAASHPDPSHLRDTLIVVSTAGAVDQLRRTLEELWLVEQWTPTKDEHAAIARGDRTALGAEDGSTGSQALVLPQIVTRAGLYRALYERMDEPPWLLDDHAREVLFQRAAAEAIARGDAPPFDVRPGLVPEMLSLYDALRRQHRRIDDFERLVGGALEAGAEIDRGARRLLQQTRFLVSAFRAYEARLAEATSALHERAALQDGHASEDAARDEPLPVDEHGLRARLLETASTRPIRRVIVAVPDVRADAAGLWPADFDLLTRVSGLDAIDIVATEAMLATGYLERLFETLPGIEVHVVPDVEAPAPRLLAPPPDGRQDPLHFTSRDREQELADVARRLAGEQRGTPAYDRMAIVYQRPLPYLYLARQVFGAYDLPWQAFDALPLAAEPYAAALDLIITFALSEYTRASGIALLRAPHFQLIVDGHAPTFAEIAACDAALRDAGFLGGRDRLHALLDRWRAEHDHQHASSSDADRESGGAADDTVRSRGRAESRSRRHGLRALAALAAAADALQALEQPALPSAHLEVLLRFLQMFERIAPAPATASDDATAPHPLPPDAATDDSLVARQLRARAAVIGTLGGLRLAFLTHGEQEGPFRDLAALVHRWLEGQTFSPRVGERGLHLVDVQAAMYGRFSHVALVGVVEGEWPAASSRSIFYPASLLRDLGWPAETERRAAARAVFDDLLRLARDEMSVSAFALEHDAIVRPSPFVEDLSGAGLSIERARASDADAGARDDVADALLTVPATIVDASELDAWVALRRARTPAAAPQFHGSTTRTEPRVYSVTGLDRYLQCPFKYFASNVLRLEEEPERRPGLTPLERGRFEHEVFQAFFERWTAAGRGAIDEASIDDARAEFVAVVDEVLARLPISERELERSRLLGSAVSAGLGERVFRFEAARAAPIAERLLEFALDGAYELSVPEEEAGEAHDAATRTRLVRLRATADRIDLLADGTMRVIDYKSGKASSAASSIQLPVYTHIAEERLDGHRGRRWRVNEAGYLAFGRQDPFVTVVAAGDEARTKVRDALARVVDVVDRIERGAFPVTPAEPYNCIFCGFAAVCRKDYVDDE